MLDRLMGMESEMPLRAEPLSEDGDSGHELYLRVVEALRGLVRTRSAGGIGGWARERLFSSNGGSVYYEVQADAFDDGLLEAGTPECRGPNELLLYMRAQDRLMTQAAEAAREASRGGIVLRRNGRDAQGNVYGPQENYETVFATGWRMWAWRSFLVLAIPWVFVASVLHWLLFVSLSALVVLMLAPFGLLSTERGEGSRFDPLLGALGRLEKVLMHLLVGPVLWATAGMVRLLGWQQVQQGALSFLVTRMIFTGAGSLRDDGFHLSEKADAMRRLFRWSTRPDDRGLLEIGHLMKAMLGPFILEFGAPLRLFRTRQRLQLGMSDAAMCDVGLWLGLATTTLVLDMAEAGALRELPQLADPLEAARAVSRGGMHAPLRLADGREVTALAVQRAYLARAQAWVRSQPTISLAAHDVLTMWQDTLDQLETDPEGLVGQLDWVTKELLIEEAGSDLPWDERKMIDLRYHELGTGYHARLRDAGAIVQLVSDEAVDRAMVMAPEDSPAALRGQLIRDVPADVELRVDWQHARVGGPLGRVIRFGDRGIE